MVLSYNEWLFEETLEPPRITIRPVYDRSGRTVMYNVHSIRLSFKVFDSDGAGGATDDFIEDVRKLLSQPAGYLVIQGIGYDDLIVNRPGGGGTRDAIWGPKPRVISCRQVADQACWHVDWECEVAIPDRCPDESSNPHKLLEWSYRVNYSVDMDGLTTRDISGTVAIPNTRKTVDNREVTETIDQHKELVMNAQRIPNFRRIPGRWNVHEDKSRAEYSFQDVQFATGSAPPPGVVEIDATHNFRNSTDSWFTYISTLSANIRIARDQPKSLSLRYFMQLFNSRQAAARAANAVLIPFSVDIREMVYAMQTSFSMSYFHTTTFKDRADLAPLAKLASAVRGILSESGLWRNPPNNDWVAWSKGMEGIDGPRGIAGLKLPKDHIVDVCDPDPSRAGKFGRFPPKKSSGLEPFKTFTVLPGIDELKKPPPPDKSWAKYSLRTWYLERDLTTRLNLLPPRPVKHSPRVINVDSDSGYRPEYDSPNENPYVYQFRAYPNITVVFEGEALRAGYMIDRPVFTEISGIKLIPMNDASCYFVTSVVADAIVPFCAMKFRLMYGLADIPGKAVATLPSPEHGGKSGGGRVLSGTFERL